MKYIGITTANMFNPIGQGVIYMVVVDSNFFRRNRFKSMTLDKLASKTDWLMVETISPGIDVPDIKKMVAYKIQTLLSSVKEFWNEDISINYPYGQSFMQDVEWFTKFKKHSIKIKYKSSSSNIIRLAQRFADGVVSSQLEDIKMIYGSLDLDKDNPNYKRWDYEKKSYKTEQETD